MSSHAIIVPDATRPLDFERVVGPQLEAGADVIVGLGLHRPMTVDELAPLQALCDAAGSRLAQHDPDAPTSFRSYDRLTCIGVVEPHQYAGFSGGVKGIVIGCGARAIIDQMHSLEMLRACGARVGWFEGNPFQARLWELAAGLPPARGVFDVPGHRELVVGEVREAFERAVSIAKRLHFTPVAAPVSSMLLRVPPSKAVNFYQASRAATYVALADHSAIAAGGTIYLEAACPEGLGEGTGERACAEAMALGSEELLRRLRDPSAPKTSGGAQRAYVLAMALERARIVLVGAPPIPRLSALRIDQIESAPPRVELVVGDPFHGVPVVGPAFTR